jgi:opacity protein-like surface antigen
MTRTKGLGMTLAVAAVAVMLAATPCAAEWFADIYIGATKPQDADARVNDRAVGPGTLHDVEYDVGSAYGGRFGAYFEAVPFVGLGVDLFRTSSYIAPQNVRTSGCTMLSVCGSSGPVPTGSFELSQTAVSLDVMLRVPIGRNKERPWGLVQPYIGGGVPIVYTTLNPVNTRLFRNHEDDSTIGWGYKGEAGVAVSVYKNLMVFGEYRYLHVEPTAFELRSTAGSGAKSTFKTEFDTHSALVGLSVRW